MTQCGKCTLCCYLIEIKASNSSPFDYCTHCVPKKGCIIYSTRPVECRQYWCSWSLDSKAHPSLRPDRFHVIFENINERIVLGIVEPGYKAEGLIADQINSFLRDGSSVVLKLVGRKPLVYLTRGARGRDVMQVITNKLKDYQDDTAKLYN